MELVSLYYYLSYSSNAYCSCCSLSCFICTPHSILISHLACVFHQTIQKYPSLVGTLKASLLTAVNVMKHVI